MISSQFLVSDTSWSHRQLYHDLPSWVCRVPNLQPLLLKYTSSHPVLCRFSGWINFLTVLKLFNKALHLNNIMQIPNFHECSESHSHWDIQYSFRWCYTTLNQYVENLCRIYCSIWSPLHIIFYTVMRASNCFFFHSKHSSSSCTLEHKAKKPQSLGAQK